MIKISEATIDTYIAQQKRDQMVYIKRLMKQMHDENEELYTSILSSARKCAKYIANMRNETNISDEEFIRHIEMNVLLYCMSVYHCIDMQLEVNDLEKTYGEG